MAKIICNNSKKNIKKYKNFFPKNFKGGTLKEQKAVLLNAINFYDGRSKIIRLFENKDIRPSHYPHNAKSEPEEFEEAKEFEPKNMIEQKNQNRNLKKI